MKEYIIRGGVAGRERLKLLADAMKLYTGTLLDDCGVTEGQSVLDVGCGGGDVTLEFARRVGAKGRVTGLDLDAVELGIAREEAAAKAIANVEYRVANVLSDAIPERFDVVYARFVLSHLAMPDKGVARMAACLKPGGILVLEDVDFRGSFCYPPRPSFDRYVEAYERSARKRGVDPHMGARLPSLLAGAGLTIQGARVVNPAALEGPVKAISPITFSAIAESVIADGSISREAIEADVADLWAAVEDPSVFMSMPRVGQAWARLG